MPSISDFVANLRKNGLARTNRFFVTVTPPARLRNTEMMRQMQFQCEGASIPGSTIETQDYRSYDMPAKIPGQKTLENLDLTFRVDRNFKVLQFFKNWTDTIYDPSTGDVAYFDDIKGKVEVQMVGNDGYSVLKVTADEAYPVSTHAITLDWGNDGEYAKLQVSFAFRYLNIEPEMVNLSGAMTTTAPDPVDNTMQPVKNLISQGQSFLRANIRTEANGTYVPLNGILNRLTNGG